MNKIFTIAKWEYFEKVKTKAFVISLIITPVIIVLFAVLPTLLSNKEELQTKIIGIVDTSSIFIAPLSYELENHQIDEVQPRFVLINLTDLNKPLVELKVEADNDVFDNKIDGYLCFSNGGTDSLAVEYRSKNIGSFRELRILDVAINNIRVKTQLARSGFDPVIAELVQKNVKIEQIKIEKDGKEGKQDFLVTFFSAFIYILLLVMMVIYSGQMLVRSMIEEKSNKLIEIIISSCTSEQLLTGKILGLSALGLTQIIIWSLIGLTLMGGAVIPQDAFKNFLPMLLYFIIGFLFYTTIFVGMGSLVTTEQEAQQMTTYISLILILPIVIAVPAIQNPDSTIVNIMSYIPFTIPSIMLLRFKIAPVPITDIILTLSIMIFSIIFTIKLASKVFRIGILSYGTKPTIKEIIKWSGQK
ncbi:MAG: ABC transporter permease [Ignavibacteria bacterium]|jgi:ABC-2 type transport system permease protein